LKSKILRLKELGEAIGMDPRTLRRGFEQGWLRFVADDVPPSGSGKAVEMCRQTAIQAAVALQLNAIGMPMLQAGQIARVFTDSGGGGRAPSELFEHGRTVLFVGSDGSEIKNVRVGESFVDVLNGSDRAIILNLNAIVAKVDDTLNKARK
jgi:hypothetical protein